MAYNESRRYQTDRLLRTGQASSSFYHRTCIVRLLQRPEPLATGTGYRLPTIVLRTDGWKSVTTKRKMNQAANEFNLPFQVWQHKGQWWRVRTDAGEFAFDGDTFAFDARHRRADRPLALRSRSPISNPFRCMTTCNMSGHEHVLEDLYVVTRAGDGGDRAGLWPAPPQRRRGALRD